MLFPPPKVLLIGFAFLYKIHLAYCDWSVMFICGIFLAAQKWRARSGNEKQIEVILVENQQSGGAIAPHSPCKARKALI